MLALTRYGPLGASSRLRMLQYLPALAGTGIHVTVQALFDDRALATRYRRGRYGMTIAARCFARRVATLQRRNGFDLLWIEKEALPWWPLWAETRLLRGVPYVLDYDDAVFHNYDRHRLSVVRRTLGGRIDGLMAKAALVVCGNEYLAQRARTARAPRVEVVPTVIDLERYPLPIQSANELPRQPLRIVWIGSPSTVHYLRTLAKPLRALAQRLPFVLRVIGGEIAMAGVTLECVAWSESTEVRSIAGADIGVMPLLDSPWERGKCGYKLIQYMACGLPVVASPVGVNTEIVRPGVNGELAGSDADWLAAFDKLLTDADLRSRMGAAGRRLVEDRYCLQVQAPCLATLLRSGAQIPAIHS